MKNLMKFENFGNKKPDINTSKKIEISEEQANLFSSDVVLRKLVSDDKVSLMGTEVYYDEDSVKTILDQYFN